MKKQLFPVLIVALLGFSVWLFADVKVDYNKKSDFGRYHTYSWIKVQADDLWRDRISSAVDSQLTAKGWEKVPSGGDAGVAAFGSRTEQKTLQTFYDGFGGGWFWRGFDDGMATTSVINTPVGTLVVDIFDNATKKLIWRGIGSDTLSEKPQKDEKKLDKAVEEMFKNFPPRSKG